MLQYGVETRLVRVSDKVHRDSCRYAKGDGALGWIYAEKNPEVDWLAEGWLSACKVCNPPSPLEGPRVLHPFYPLEATSELRRA